ncbi:hypothetical protein [Pseudomonas fragi]|uniref:hypothetical protein n=1 Tax=Pseudomonas fragi TaxID=296 RepID=UPI0020066408|nr:hypothetical protein [Pseudomonas fragi]MCK6251265.1 hypothetical protein [Pseudomonas fragi]
MNKNSLPVEKNKKTLSTREWCLVIAILALIQFFVHWVSYQFGGSPNALGYVSFAGTLVSIMLGLIAIIYSFVQSISQSTSVVEIREQVERLIVAGNEISESGKMIHSASQEVNGLVGDLASKVIENTSTSMEVLGSVSKLTSELNLSSSSIHVRKTSEVADGVSEAGKSISILDSDRVVIRLMTLCTYEAAKRKYTVSQAEKLILPELGKNTDVNVNFLVGAFNAVILAIEGEGYTSFDEESIEDDVIKVSEKFNVRMKELIPETMSGDEPLFNQFWQTINGLSFEKIEVEKGE